MSVCSGNTTPYVVQTGETVAILATRFGTTVEAITAANPTISTTNLVVGSTICIPVTTTVPTCPSGSNAYTVQTGETFFILATRFGTTTAAIAVINPGINPDNIPAGTVICIPGAPVTRTCPTGSSSYTVRSGDTFFNLALQFNTTATAIANLNPGINPNNIPVGTILCIPTGTVPSTCPAGTSVYIIRAGDTIFLIAQRFGTTVAAITAANPGIDINNLKVGSTLCIPGATPTGCPAGTTPYIVQPGDTVFLIAQRFGTTVNAILAANPGIDVNNLRIGSTLCIPGTTPPPGRCPTGTMAYTVKAGDTFFLLAKQFGTTVAAIQAANPTVDPMNIQIGSTLCIPTGTTPGTCPTGTFAYVVKAGDTFFLLAQRFGTTVAAIQAANPTVNPLNIQIGSTLCIPGAGPTPLPTPGTPGTCPTGSSLYLIQTGDTITVVAQRFGVTVESIQAVNPGVNLTVLVVGTSICIPGAAPQG